MVSHPTLVLSHSGVNAHSISFSFCLTWTYFAHSWNQGCQSSFKLVSPNLTFFFSTKHWLIVRSAVCVGGIHLYILLWVNCEKCHPSMLFLAKEQVVLFGWWLGHPEGPGSKVLGEENVVLVNIHLGCCTQMSCFVIVPVFFSQH